MPTPFAAIALVTCLLGLGACDKTPTQPPTPIVNETSASNRGSTAGSADDPSVPAAGAVFPSATAPKADAATGRSNGAMSSTQESTAMPMPGQNNDHSAPVGPGRRASAP
ncbi:hypothetical protein [Ideonella sp. A 288]|uniref:hypothetical protein n=1 Tax=Ideonella sp. A 288 TaxID=1962181 RepID=UPI000B4ACE90|nr:hypothetical protein [Ideonella sp. A 288]